MVAIEEGIAQNIYAIPLPGRSPPWDGMGITDDVEADGAQPRTDGDCSALRDALRDAELDVERCRTELALLEEKKAHLANSFRLAEEADPRRIWAKSRWVAFTRKLLGQRPPTRRGGMWRRRKVIST